MNTFTFGEVSITRVVEIGRSSYPTTSMLPESTPEAIARHHGWLKPDFFDESTGDLGSRIQTWVVRMPGRTILIDTGVGNGKARHETAAVEQPAGHVAGRPRGRRRHARGRSTPSCARTCTSITSAGTRGWRATAGCRRSRRRAT